MRMHSLRLLGVLPLAAIATALLLAGSGCDQADETALAGPTSPEAEAVALPASFGIQDLPADLALTPEQSSAMRSAIDRLHAERSARWTEHRAKRGQRGPSSDAMGEPPIFNFLEDASQTLSAEQFVKLAQFLSDRRADRASQVGSGAVGAEIRRDAREHRSRFERKFGLSSAEGSELRTLLREKGEELRQLAREVEAGTITPEAARDRAKAIREEMKASAAEVLSPDQIAQFEQRRNARRSEMAERRLGDLSARMARRAVFLGRVLSLDATQQANVRATLEESLEARRANLEKMKSGALAPEDAMYEAWITERTVGEKVRAMLSPEQAVRFDALIKLLPPAFRFGVAGPLVH